jgi:isochorismate hydrolase
MRQNAAQLVRAPDKTALLVIDMQNGFVIPGAPVARRARWRSFR